MRNYIEAQIMSVVSFYVGVTRTKENLHIVQGKTRKEFKVMI